MLRAIVLPGLDGTGRLLEGFRAAAPAGVECAVIAYPPDQRLGYRELEAYVAGRLPAEPFVLIAESFSGPIAVRITASRDVRAVVLCGSFVTPPQPSFLRFFARTALFRLRVPERVLAFFMLSPFATPELTSAFSKTLQEVAPAVLALRLREVLSVDERDSLRRVSAPMLYLRGRFDRLVRRRVLREFTNVVQLDAPHAILQVAPDAAWQAILRSLT